MKKLSVKWMVLFITAIILTGCSGDKKTAEQTASAAELPELSQVWIPVTVDGHEIIVGKTTIQELLDADFPLMVSEWDGSNVTQHEIDPDAKLPAGSALTEISFYITDAAFARISIWTDAESIQIKEAPITRLELHLSHNVESLPEDIFLDGVSVAELSRQKAGEMFPDFEQEDLSISQRGADYQCTLMFSPKTLNLYQFSLKETSQDAPEPEIKVPSI